MLVLLPLIQLLLELWPLQPGGHPPFEQQPLEPRSATVEHCCALTLATMSAPRSARAMEPIAGESVRLVLLELVSEALWPLSVGGGDDGGGRLALWVSVSCLVRHAAAESCRGLPAE